LQKSVSECARHFATGPVGPRFGSDTAPRVKSRRPSLGAARPLPRSSDIGPRGQSVGQAARFCFRRMLTPPVASNPRDTSGVRTTRRGPKFRQARQDRSGEDLVGAISRADAGRQVSGPRFGLGGEPRRWPVRQLLASSTTLTASMIPTPTSMPPRPQCWPPSMEKHDDRRRQPTAHEDAISRASRSAASRMSEHGSVRAFVKEHLLRGHGWDRAPQNARALHEASNG
jgi:hypothetical protein